MLNVITAFTLMFAALFPQMGESNLIYKPEIAGHRGTMVGAPENTMPAFEYAADNGVTWLEFDVQWTKDGQLVVIHDATVDRTTNGTGPVSSYSLEELQALDAGSWFGENWRDVQVPTFQEVVEFAKRRGLKINAEIKVAQPFTGTITTAQGRQYIQILKDAGMTNQTVMASASPKVIRTIQKLDPKMKTALVSFTNPGKKAIISYGKVFIPRWSAFTSKNVRSMARAGVTTFVWPVRNQDQFKRALSTRAKVIIVDDPAAVEGWL